MGTFYTLGIINKFEEHATKGKSLSWGRERLPLQKNEWIEALNSRIDPSIFNLEMKDDCTITGKLKNEVFKENIKGFYEILREILGEKETVVSTFMNNVCGRVENSMI